MNILHQVQPCIKLRDAPFFAAPVVLFAQRPRRRVIIDWRVDSQFPGTAAIRQSHGGEWAAYLLVFSGFLCFPNELFDVLYTHLAVYLLEDFVALFQTMEDGHLYQGKLDGRHLHVFTTMARISQRRTRTRNDEARHGPVLLDSQVAYRSWKAGPLGISAF